MDVLLVFEGFVKFYYIGMICGLDYGYFVFEVFDFVLDFLDRDGFYGVFLLLVCVDASSAADYTEMALAEEFAEFVEAENVFVADFVISAKHLRLPICGSTLGDCHSK